MGPLRSLFFVLLLCATDVVAASQALRDLALRLEAGQYQGITGALVVAGGDRVVDVPGAGVPAGDRRDIRSATKSVTALLVGELIEDGRLEDVRTPVSGILPDLYAGLEPGDPRREITVEDLLTMRSGLACDDWVPSSLGNEERMYGTRDWSAFVVALPRSHLRGEHFSYCTGGVILLGRVIEALSGMDVPAYANERLFGPLGITGARWDATPEGHTDTGGHLRLTIHDLLKLGQLIHADGAWDGKALVSSDWIEAITTSHTRIEGRRETYGYLWWLQTVDVRGRPITLRYAHGNGGTFVVIVRELDLVAAFTGENYGRPEQFIPMKLLVEVVIPALLEP